MLNYEFLRISGQKVRFGDLGLQYFWKKYQWVSQDLPCLIRHYYCI